MSFLEGDLVKEKGKQTGVFKVRKIENETHVTVYGGKQWQWRTLAIDTLRSTTKKEARDFLRAEEQMKEALPKARTHRKGKR